MAKILKKVLIQGDQEEGMKYMGLARHLIDEFVKQNMDKNPRAQTIKPLSDTMSVLIQLLDGKPRGIIFGDEISAYLSVMYNGDFILSDYPDTLVSPYQPLRYKSLYLKSITPIHKLKHYAGGVPGNNLEPITIDSVPFCHGYEGGSWHDEKFERAITWINSTITSESTIFLGGNFGIIPFKTLPWTTQGFSRGSALCFIASIKIISATSIAVIYTTNTSYIASPDTNHLLIFSISLNTSTGLLDFIQTNDLPLISNIIGGIRPQSYWTGFTYDSSSIAVWGGGSIGISGDTTTINPLTDLRILRFNTDYSSYTVEIANTLSTRADRSLWFSYVKAEKNSFSIAYNQAGAQASYKNTIISLLSYSNGAFSIKNPSVIVYQRDIEFVSFGFLSLDNNIYLIRHAYTDNTTINLWLYRGGFRIFSDFMFDDDLGIHDNIAMLYDQRNEIMNSGDNKFITIISSSNYIPKLFYKVQNAIVIDNKSYNITEISNIDVYADPNDPTHPVRYPIGLTFIPTRALSGDLYIPPV